MQYYKTFMKKSSDMQSGSAVVCLNRVISICVEKANALYSCKTEFICPAELMYIEADIDTVTAEIAQILDKYFARCSNLTAQLIKQDSPETAMLVFFDQNGVKLCSIDFILYTGTPQAVIRDPESDLEIFKIADRTFTMLRELRKRGV